MRKTRNVLLLTLTAVAIVLLLCGGFMSTAFAQDVTDKFVNDEGILCYQYAGGITSYVISCIQNVMITSVQYMLKDFLNIYRAFILAAMVLSVTLYGALFLTGSIRHSAGDTFLTIIKFTTVCMLAFQITEYVPWIFDIAQALQDAVSEYLALSTTTQCTAERLNALFPDHERWSVWERIDCLFISLVGMVPGSAVPIGIIALLAMVVFTGGIGLVIILAAFSFFMMLLTGIVKAMKIYLVSMLTVGMLLIIAPIFLPMMLFKSTAHMFKKWFLTLGAHLMIPMFMVAYLTMMVGIYDALIYKGPYSLWFAIAGEASQTENFSFSKWIEEGKDGNGDVVDTGIPDSNTITLIGYKIACDKAGDDKDALDQLGGICDLPLDRMLDCSINPPIPVSGQNEAPPEDGDCTPLRNNPDYKDYHGFQKNEEIMHFALLTNLESDRDRRKREREENKGCGWNPLCYVKKGAGAIFNAFKSFIGYQWRFIGWLAQVAGKVQQFVGSAIKWVAQKLDTGCRMTPLPGVICSTGSGILSAQGSLIDMAGTALEGVGTVVNFTGRILTDGLVKTFKDLISSWIDVNTLDIQKVVSYKCSKELGITDPKSTRYVTDCPGMDDYILNIIYCFVTIIMMAYLTRRWMVYIPMFGKELIESNHISSGLATDNILAEPARILESKMFKRPNQVARK